MSQPPPRRFECTVPHCGKLFNRKEHLTRHLKSHDPEPQYQCPICGRRYARSDVLKRHIEFHPQFANAKQNAARNAGIPSSSGPAGSSTGTDAASAADTSPGGFPDNPNTSSLMNLDPGMGDVLTAQGRPPQPWYPPQDSWSSTPFSMPGFGMDSTASGWPPGSDSSVPGVVTQSASVSPSMTGLTTTSSQGLGVPGPHPASGSVTVPPEAVGASNIGSSPSSTTSPASTHYTSTVLRPLVHRDSPLTRRLVEIYFADIHPYWPLLHVPTFDMAKVPDVLLASMVMLASLMQNGPEHVELAPVVFKEVMAINLQSNASVHTLQALLLCILYCLCSMNMSGMQTKAIQLSGILFAACRYLNIFTGEQEPSEGLLDDTAFSHWLVQEQLHRIAYGALRVDAFLCILTDHPATVRFQEITIPLPKTESLWRAATDDERRKLQWAEPAGRERAPFCYLLREALEIGREPILPYRLSAEDYHIGLAALQPGVWEAAREAHSFAADGLAIKMTPDSSAMIWLHHLLLWRTEIEKETNIGKDYWMLHPGNSDYTIAPLTLTMWHISTLKVNAPLSLIRVPSNYVGRALSDSIGTQHPRSKLRTWMSSDCCRASAWHGIQLGRVLEHEMGSHTILSARLKLNPIIIPGVVMGAMATCFYAHQVRACPNCTGSRVNNTIDLLVAEHDGEEFSRWKQTGEGLATLGPNGIPVCQCGVESLATWFCGLLVIDETAKAEFQIFLADLGKVMPGRG